MKALILVCVMALCNISLAMSGKAPPPNDHSGREQCAFYDSGDKEEHGPHRSLNECRASHGNCQERCFMYYQRCSVEGIRAQIERGPDGRRVEKESKRIYEGSHRDSFRALEIALRSCETDHPYNDHCVRKSCVEQYERTR